MAGERKDTAVSVVSRRGKRKLKYGNNLRQIHWKQRLKINQCDD
jgi:hypothetical protein